LSTATSSGTAYFIMGVCGVGKTSIGRRMAGEIDATYIEGDDYHSHANIASMRAGQGLTDQMRQPWLLELTQAAETARQKSDVVVACSALRQHYRSLIRERVKIVQFIYLTGERKIIAERLKARADHFTKVDLLESQLGTLEPPTPEEDPITLKVNGSEDEVFADLFNEISRRENAFNPQFGRPGIN